MATTLTARLKLAKQATGDEPGTWAATQNDSYDDADERLFLRGAGEPDGSVESHYLGQRYLDTDTEIWWTATSVGAAADWTSDLDIIDAAITHPIPTTHAQDYSHGHLIAALEWVSATQVKLVAIAADGEIYYDNNAERVSYTGDFTFDITTDREGAQTLDATTPYHLYMDYSTLSVALTPEPIISKTVPNARGTDPAGYHPTEVDWRSVGSIWVNSASEITKFKMVGNKMVFNEADRDGDHHYNLIRTGQSALREVPLNVPLTCEAVQLFLMYYAGGAAGYVVFAQDGKSITLSDGGGLPLTIEDYGEIEILMQQDISRGMVATWDMPVITKATPKFLYGHNDNNDPDELEVVVHGYTDIWAPRGY